MKTTDFLLSKMSIGAYLSATTFGIALALNTGYYLEIIEGTIALYGAYLSRGVYADFRSKYVK